MDATFLLQIVLPILISVIGAYVFIRVGLKEADMRSKELERRVQWLESHNYGESQAVLVARYEDLKESFKALQAEIHSLRDAINKLHSKP
jgi:cell division protein FtsB